MKLSQTKFNAMTRLPAAQPGPTSPPQRLTLPNGAIPAPQPYGVVPPSGLQRSASPNPALAESKGLFDAHYAKAFYKDVVETAHTKRNLLEFMGGALGFGITEAYLGLTGLAEKGVRDSLELAHQGQAEGGLYGGFKQGLGYGLTFIPSQLTEERAPMTLGSIAAMPVLGEVAATKLGQAILSNPLIKQAVLPAIETAGALFSGTQVYSGATGTDLLSGKKLTEEERVSATGQGALGLLGTGLLLKDKAGELLNGAKAMSGNVGRFSRRLLGQQQEGNLSGGIGVGATDLNPSAPTQVSSAPGTKPTNVGTAELQEKAAASNSTSSYPSGIVGAKAKSNIPQPDEGAPQSVQVETFSSSVAPTPIAPKANTSTNPTKPPEISERFAEILQLKQQGKYAEALELSRDLKTELGPEHTALQREYLQTRQGSALEGHRPQVSERSTPQGEHRLRASEERTQSRRFAEMMESSKGGDRTKAAQLARQLKEELGPDRYAALRRDYLASAQGRSLQGVRPQAGTRSDTKVEHKIQSSARRLFPGQQSNQNCGLQVCQQFLYAYGISFTEGEMEALGASLAGYSPNVGTPIKRIPELLRSQGIGANTFENSLQTIEIGIENGQGVLVGVDEGVYSGGKATYDAHAVFVTNVTKNTEGDITHYLINNTGTGKIERKSTELFERSLIPVEANYPAVLTDDPISLGGRTASRARLKAQQKYVEANEVAKGQVKESTSIPVLEGSTAENIKNKSGESQAQGKVQAQKSTLRSDGLVRVAEPGEQIGKLESYEYDADVPIRYRNNPRFNNLARDPDKGGAIRSESRAEAMAGLEAEAQDLIPGPIKRGPKETEFYDADGRPWDVKAPPSPQPGDVWSFRAEQVGNSIRKELRLKSTPKGAPAGTYPHEKTGFPEPRRIILDSSYMTKENHKALWEWLNKNLTPVELKNIVEVNVNVE